MIKILALRARTPRSNTTLEHHVHLTVKCGRAPVRVLGHGTDLGDPTENRVEAAFALYDLNGDGVITPDEMRNMMESVFKVVFYVDPSHREKLGGIDPKELAESTWCSSVVFERGIRARSARMSLILFTYSEDSLVSLTQPITLSLHCIPHLQ